MKVSVIPLVLLMWMPIQAQIPDWENPTMFDQDKESPHTTFIPFKDEKALLTHESKVIPLFTVPGRKLSFFNFHNASILSYQHT